MTIEFLNHFFGHRDKYSAPPILLLLDDFKGHWTADVLSKATSLNVSLLNVPAHCTGVCQPADIAWNHPFKSRMRAQWVSYLQAQLQRPAVQPTMLSPKRDDVMGWIQAAWKGLSSRTIANGFTFVPADEASRECETIVDDDSDAFTRLVITLKDMKLIDTDIGDVTMEEDVIDALIAKDGVPIISE